VSARLVAYVIWLGVCFFISVALAAGARRRLGVGWNYFGSGVLAGLVLMGGSLALLRTYLFRLLAIPWLGLNGSILLIGFYFAVLLEVGRYAGYLWLTRSADRTWKTAVAYGLGLGVASVIIGPLVNPVALGQGSIASIGSMLANQPAQALVISGWSLLCGMAVHVALAVLVLQVYRRRSLLWLWFAILVNMLWHAGPDLLIARIVQTYVLLNNSGVFQFSRDDIMTVAGTAVLGMAALWIVNGLRERPRQTSLLEDACSPR
jgi:uncharacterized membrane protein YhfC